MLTPKEHEVVAHHEMRHALVALALPGAEAVHEVSIIPRGIDAIGYTIRRPTEDRYLMTRAELERKIAVPFGGRAAERLVFGELSTGAADDLARATDIARDMITRYGIEESLGDVVFEAQQPRFLDVPGAQSYGGGCISEQTQRRIDDAIRAVVMNAFERATVLLEANRDLPEASAAALLARETLDEPELAEIGRRPRPTASPRPSEP
jgi:cell division protease FtsH